MIIYAHDDISARLAQLTAEYEAAVVAYEARVPNVTTVEGMLRELDRLAHGEP